MASKNRSGSPRPASPDRKRQPSSSSTGTAAAALSVAGAGGTKFKNEKQATMTMGKKTLATIYKNPMLNASKIKKIPVSQFRSESQQQQQDPRAKVQQNEPQEPELEEFLRPPPVNKWVEGSKADVLDRDQEWEENEAAGAAAVKKRSSKKLVLPEPDFSKMPADEIVRYLQKEQRLSFVPSSKSISSRKSTQEVNSENQKDNFISSPPAGNPFHPEETKSSTSSTKSLVRRKIELPWRKLSTFTSPSAQRKKVFQSFHKTSPEPPRTPTPPPPEANTSKSFITERKPWNAPQRPARSISIEARHISQHTHTEKVKFKSQQFLKESRQKERESRRHIADSQNTVISQGREMAVLSKSTNGLAAIVNKTGKRLKSQKGSKASELYEDRDLPPIMEGARRAELQKIKRSQEKSRETKPKQVEPAGPPVNNMFIGNYDGPDSSSQLQR